MENMCLNEVWRDVPEWEGWYQASTLGNIKSLDRLITDKRNLQWIRKGKILKPKVCKRTGHLLVRLAKSNIQEGHNVGNLVARTFVPNPNSLPFACHKDDNPSHNYPDNLFWGTHLDNMNDKVSKNRQSKGENHGRVKLSETDIISIRKLLSEGKSKIEISTMYKVAPSTIHKISNNERWKHLK